MLTDIAGVGLIILSVLTGWIPGPGGIPLFLAGLALLAINHEWARRLLHKVKTQGVRLAELFFSEHKVIMIIYDVVALLLVSGGVYILLFVQNNIRATAGIFIILGLSLFLGNRKRLQRIVHYFRTKLKQ